MAWAHIGGGSNQDGGAVNTTTVITVAPGVVVAAGNTVKVAVTWSPVHGAVTDADVTDQLGNTYSKGPATANDNPNDQSLDIYTSIVTNAGTPVVTVEFEPAPGTTGSGSVSVAVDIFTGSDASSTIDGSSGQNQVTPGTGTDALSSGAFSTTHDGVLLYTATVDTATGNNPGAAGTGFTAGQSSTFVVLKTAWKVQTTHGAGTAGTWTAAVDEAHLTLCDATTPAGVVGGGGGDAYNARRRRHKARRA